MAPRDDPFINAIIWHLQSFTEWNAVRKCKIITMCSHPFKSCIPGYHVCLNEIALSPVYDVWFRVFEIRRTEGVRFSAGPTEASYLAVLLSAKHFVVVLYVMAFPNMSRGYWFLVKQIAYATLVLNITVVFVQVS